MLKAEEYSYWIALAHLPQWSTERKNTLIRTLIASQDRSLKEVVNNKLTDLKKQFSLSSQESTDISQLTDQCVTTVDVTEKLISEDVEIILFGTPDYPTTLSNNLGIKYSPSLLYIKGNPQLFFKYKRAVVGCRNVNERGVEFTKRIAETSVRDNKVIVSGYARGVDRLALDTALEHDGSSIVVLPQGILTFASGLKKLARYIASGRVVLVSTYPPQAGWSVGQAMGRNTYIYGLADEIFVAQADSKGGTWNGVLDGLKRGRKIFIRQTSPDERCANNELITRGAIAVDAEGNIIASSKRNPESVNQKTLLQF
jgi:predicted Rossmann fold nucleotide-binding protein DprA/Smf involved in DNA uptake